MSWGQGSGPDWTAAIIWASFGGVIVAGTGFVGALYLHGDVNAGATGIVVTIAVFVAGCACLARGSQLAERSRRRPGS